MKCYFCDKEACAMKAHAVMIMKDEKTDVTLQIIYNGFIFLCRKHDESCEVNKNGLVIRGE